MLVVTRKIHQSITIGDNVRVVVVDVEGDEVQLGIEAPRATPVYRSEILSRIAKRTRKGGTTRDVAD